MEITTPSTKPLPAAPAKWPKSAAVTPRSDVAVKYLATAMSHVSPLVTAVAAKNRRAAPRFAVTAVVTVAVTALVAVAAEAA